MKKNFYITVFTTCLSSICFSQNQIEMNEAAHQKYKNADVELNKVYGKLMSKLDKIEKPLLVAAEKDWIKYRDSHCKFEGASYEGGSMQPMVISGCLEALTRKRIAEIKENLKDRE